jgi:hypothetical protein
MYHAVIHVNHKCITEPLAVIHLFLNNDNNKAIFFRPEAGHGSPVEGDSSLNPPLGPRAPNREEAEFPLRSTGSAL